MKYSNNEEAVEYTTFGIDRPEIKIPALVGTLNNC